jgi:hypothetical protein
MADFISPITPDNLAQWQKPLAGKHLSSWPIFCYAVAGNVAVSTEKSSHLLSLFREARDKGDLQNKRRAIVFMEAQMQYNALIIGPLLGAIVLSVFAMESFLWLVASSKLRERCGDSEADIKLAKLDRISLSERLKKILSLVGASHLPVDLEETIDELAQYRNLCAHDTPQIYSDEIGHMLKFRRGKTGPTPERRFPLPADEPFPLSLGHALLAAQTHDRLVQHVQSKEPALLEKNHLLGSRWSIVEQLPLVGLPIDKVQKINDVWDAEVGAFVSNVTTEELEQFRHDLWGEGGFFQAE